jgi:hypothetical protein
LRIAMMGSRGRVVPLRESGDGEGRGPAVFFGDDAGARGGSGWEDAEEERARVQSEHELKQVQVQEQAAEGEEEEEAAAEAAAEEAAEEEEVDEDELDAITAAGPEAHTPCASPAASACGACAATSSILGA